MSSTLPQESVNFEDLSRAAVQCLDGYNIERIGHKHRYESDKTGPVREVEKRLCGVLM